LRRRTKCKRLQKWIGLKNRVIICIKRKRKMMMLMIQEIINIITEWEILEAVLFMSIL
jgi:hypothetical protein